MRRNPRIDPRAGDILRKGTDTRTVYGLGCRASEPEWHVHWLEQPPRDPFADIDPSPTESEWREWAKDAEVLCVAFELPRPFSNGSQFMDWQERNCCRCAKYSFAFAEPRTEESICQIELALHNSAWGTGQVTHEIARRMGFTDPLAYTWQCGEFELMPEHGAKRGAA